MSEYKREKYEQVALLLHQFSQRHEGRNSQALLKNLRCCAVSCSHG